MVQGVFLELGSCFLAKMACISPTKSRVKHRTLKIFFFRLYQHGLSQALKCNMWIGIQIFEECEDIGEDGPFLLHLCKDV